MVYYKDLIDLKLREGEDIHEDHHLVDKLNHAMEQYQRWLEPRLTVEEIAELNDF